MTDFLAELLAVLKQFGLAVVVLCASVNSLDPQTLALFGSVLCGMARVMYADVPCTIRNVSSYLLLSSLLGFIFWNLFASFEISIERRVGLVLIAAISAPEILDVLISQVKKQAKWYGNLTNNLRKIVKDDDEKED